MIDPRAVALGTGHPGESGRARSDRRPGGEPGTAIGAIDLLGMFVAHFFHDLSENLFAQGLVLNRRRIFQSRSKLQERFLIRPRAMPAWTGHSTCADRYPSLEVLSALRTSDWLDVLAPQFLQYFFVTLMGPLILASRFNLVEFVTQTIFLVAHITPQIFAMCSTCYQRAL
ncbi:MAG: hypothetical protein ACREQH_08020 [Candidatus Binatus sp.]